MIRKIIIAVLLLAAILTSGLTLDSYRRDTHYACTVNAHNFLMAFFSLGTIKITHTHGMEPVVSKAFARYVMGEFPFDKKSAAMRNLTYFGYRQYVSIKPMVSARVVSFPFWVPIAVFMAYPTVAFIRGPYRRWRRKRKGLCLKCGYDLRESPERCPECGTEVKE